MKINWKILGGYCLGVAAANLFNKGSDLVCASDQIGWFLMGLNISVCYVAVCLATEKP